MNNAVINSSATGTTNDSNFIDPGFSIFVLRVSLGLVLIAHSIYLKMIVFTLPGTAQFFASIGLPAMLAYVVFIIEAIAGVAIIAGYRTRLFAALIIPVLLGATWTHFGNGWLFSNKGGGWEYPLILAVIAFAQIGLGNGSYSIQRDK